MRVREGGRKEGRRDNRKGWDERQGGVEEGSDRKDLLLLVCFTSCSNTHTSEDTTRPCCKAVCVECHILHTLAQTQRGYNLLLTAERYGEHLVRKCLKF